MDEINKLIDDMTLDYENNQAMNSDIKKTNEINKRFNNMHCDNIRYVNPRGISYDRTTQSSVKYNTIQHSENTSQTIQNNSNHNNPIQRDTLNNRIGNFHFDNPAINQKTYNPLYIHQSLSKNEFPEIYHTKSKKAENQTITNNRLSEYNPICRAIPTPVQYQQHKVANNNYMSSQIQQNSKNIKEIDSQRMTEYQPLSRARQPVNSSVHKNIVPNKLPSNARL